MTECLHEKHKTGLVENLPDGTKQVVSDEKLGTEALDWLRIWNTLAVFDNGKKIQIEDISPEEQKQTLINTFCHVCDDALCPLKPAKHVEYFFEG